MKKNICILFSIFVVSFSNAQFNTASQVDVATAEENAFLDASNYSDTTNWGVSKAKGFVFPQVDLTQFRFNADNVTPFFFPTAFDGMIVYNIGSGPIADPKLTTAQENVEPGFYYFYNPDGKSTLLTPGKTGDDAIANGKWIRLGSGGSTTIKNTPSVIGKIDGANLYAVKGDFTAPGGATVTIPNLNTLGITSIYSIKIYKGGTKKLVASSLSSYDVANNKVVIGVGNMTMSLEATNYDYVLEYFK